MYFKIKYISKGKVKEVIIFSKSIKNALNKFKNKKLGILIDIEEFDKPSFVKEFLKKIDISKIDLEEFIVILEQMYVMLDAGITIDLTLQNSIKSIKNRKLKYIFNSVLKDVKSGFSLTHAFSRFEKEIGVLIIAMIRLGEETGDLAEAIRNLATLLEEILNNKKRLKKATRYPIFTIFTMSIAFVIVILFVIPPFKSIFTQLKTDLPLPTKFLLWLEALISNYGLYLLINLFAMFFILLYLYNTKKYIKLKIDEWLLKLYIIGSIIKLAMIGRFIYALQRLIDSGVPILDAVNIALKIVDNLYIKNRLEYIKKSIISGGSIAKGFKKSGLFEDMIIQMISAGEESGALVLMLQKIANYYLKKYRQIVDNITMLIEPILIIIIAGFVAILALGVFLPMWSFIETI